MTSVERVRKADYEAKVITKNKPYTDNFVRSTVDQAVSEVNNDANDNDSGGVLRVMFRVLVDVVDDDNADYDDDGD